MSKTETGTTELRQNSIDSIMNLDESNPYKQRLLEIMQYYEKGELTDISAYVLINDTLVNYDFNVVVPYEQKAIAEQRKCETEKSYELLSGVPIYDPDDITEIAVKTKTQIGQIFPDGFMGFCRTIGVKNFNMKDRKKNLITDLKKISKGKQKIKTEEISKQYCDFQKIPNSKRYAIQLTDIFEIPHYIEKEDRRGKNGFYIKHLMPIMIFYLWQKHKSIIYTNVDELSCFVGLVTKNYKKISAKELAEINPQFTNAMHHFTRLRNKALPLNQRHQGFYNCI